MSLGRTRPQQGFAAIAAVFLVVLLAALGAFMLSFSNTQQLTAAQDVLGSRAYWAARKGLEWGFGGTTPTTTTCPTSPKTITVDVFTVVITCSVTSYNEAAATVYILRFTSVASTGSPGSVGRIERSLSGAIER
jgi:MSHA biogenesis protein MshP